MRKASHLMQHFIGRPIRRFIGLMLALSAVGLIAAFVAVNRERVTIGLWPFRSVIEAELWVFVFIGFWLGLLIGVFFMGLKLLAIRTKLWAQDRQIDRLSTDTPNEHKKNTPIISP